MAGKLYDRLRVGSITLSQLTERLHLRAVAGRHQVEDEVCHPPQRRRLALLQTARCVGVLDQLGALHTLQERLGQFPLQTGVQVHLRHAAACYSLPAGHGTAGS